MLAKARTKLSVIITAKLMTIRYLLDEYVNSAYPY